MTTTKSGDDVGQRPLGGRRRPREEGGGGEQQEHEATERETRRRSGARREPLAARNHSPTGPAWGYGGSGPAQLALVILLAVTDEATAERFYQRFKRSVIAPIEANRWALGASDVLGWLEPAATGIDRAVRSKERSRAQEVQAPQTGACPKWATTPWPTRRATAGSTTAPS